jgi:hypothetical protein
MIRRLGKFLILAGLICLIIFFTSSAFLFEDGWFLVAGIGCISFGLLLRRSTNSRKRRKRKRWGRGQQDEDEDE